VIVGLLPWCWGSSWWVGRAALGWDWLGRDLARWDLGWLVPACCFWGVVRQPKTRPADSRCGVLPAAPMSAVSLSKCDCRGYLSAESRPRGDQGRLQRPWLEAETRGRTELALRQCAMIAPVQQGWRWRWNWLHAPAGRASGPHPLFEWPAEQAGRRQGNLWSQRGGWRSPPRCWSAPPPPIGRCGGRMAAPCWPPRRHRKQRRGNSLRMVLRDAVVPLPSRGARKASGRRSFPSGPWRASGLATSPCCCVRVMARVRGRRLHAGATSGARRSGRHAPCPAAGAAPSRPRGWRAVLMGGVRPFAVAWKGGGPAAGPWVCCCWSRAW